jgi:putative DNA primase/helicase
MSLDFLNQLRPGGPWAITAIVPDGKTVTETFTDHDACEAFIRKRNVDRNVYYTLNAVKTAVSSKPTKQHIAQVEYLHVDADPDAGETPEQFKTRFLPTVRAFRIAPTFIVDSGNGVQLLWRLKRPVAATGPDVVAGIEARNLGLLMELGAPRGTQNIDRLLRLPGTINYPNAAKRKKGRVQCETKLIEGSATGGYPLDDFPEHLKTKKEQAKPQAEEKELPPHLASLLHVEGHGPYTTRSELLFAFLKLGLRAGIGEDAIVDACLDGAFAGKGIFEHVKENGGEPYVKRQIEQALNDMAPATAEDQKQIIRVKSGGRHDAVKATEQALFRAHCPVFYRGGSLVEPLWRWERTAEKNRDALVTMFVKLNVSRFSNMTSKHAARFQRYDKRSKSWDPIDPPKDVVETLLDLGHWGFSTVVGIVNSPTMRPDGSLITEPGYDTRTQLWHKPAGDVELPPIPERPTKDDARAALGLLTGLLAGFPFVKGDDDKSVAQSVALAAILTTTLRGAFDVTPLFVFLAPESGTGKTYLVKIISIIATGRDATAVVGCRNPEEMEKRLGAAAFEALPILSLNNLSFDLESDLLCQMVSDGVVGIRPLGKSEMIRCDCRGTTVFANGNNIRLVGDLVRRTLTCHLDAKLESPETRSFDFDPVALVKADRGKYLAAVFTIARAYMAAGCPTLDGAASLAGFDEWSKIVRLPLMWLGMPDPAMSMEGARSLDPKREALRSLITAWVTYIGVGKEVTAAEIANLALEADTADTRRFKHRELFDALSRDGRNVSSKSIGNQLMKELGRVADGYRIERVAESRREGHRYVLVDTRGRAPAPEPEPKGETF